MLSRQLGQTLSRYLYSTIKVETDNNKQVAYMTLSNPKKRNPLSLDTLQQMFEGLK